MPELILNLRRETLDVLNQIAVEAEDPRFTDAKGMLELRATLEVRDRRISIAVEAARKAEESKS